MELRGIDFGNVLGASGVQGFFGEGYWFHYILRLFGLNFRGMTFVAKTTTLNERAGFMPLTKRFTPRQLFPPCIWITLRSWWLGFMLNAVGLSGPGARTLLDTGKWQKKTKPFFISFMPMGDTRKKRLDECRKFVALIRRFLPYFRGFFGIQLNESCPNTKHDLGELVAECVEHLDILGRLEIPIMVKLNLLVPPERAITISKHPACDAICIGNTVPFGELAERINWKKLFPLDGISPLKHLGGGGLSGEPLFGLVCEWVQKVLQLGMEKPLNVCGGILSPWDVGILMIRLRPGVDSISIGSVAVLRPWRVQRIIRYANRMLSARQAA